MRRSISLSVAASLSLLALPAVGQEDGGNVAMIHCVDAQPGMQTRLEEGLKKHRDWHQKQNDTWSWYTWTVLTGPETDRYCTGTFGHKWEDFDKPAVSPEADHADAMATIAPFASNHQASFWVFLPEVSRPAEEPAPMTTAIFFTARQGKGDELPTLVGEFNKAIEKAGVPWRYEWYRLASGGQEGTFVLVLPRANFADFAPTGKTFDEVLVEAYGKAGAEALNARWDEVVERTDTQLSRGRHDLSYIPAP